MGLTLECRTLQSIEWVLQDRKIKRTCVGVKFQPYLEGQGDLVSRPITPIPHVVTLVIPLIKKPTY